jgi:transglutaminase-like putative cysteine protease
MKWSLGAGKDSAAANPRPLDVGNVMWLLAAMAFVVGPHLLRLPNWLGIFFLGVVAWRAWIAWSALRSPPAPLMWAIALMASIGVFQTFGRIVGREGGVALLILMAALKLLEMKSQRDVILCIYLGFFLVWTNFLFSQTIPLGLYMVVCVWIFVATLVGFNRVRRPKLSERLRPAASLVVQALPLMVAFFILFPRTTGPLWALPTDSSSGKTGLSDSMTPGNIAQLIKSEAIAFRVAFPDGMPPYRTLYWRGPVMVDFDGSTWKMRAYASRGRVDHPRRERPVRYSVNLEPHHKNWLFALDVPGSVPAGTTLLSDMQMRYRRPVIDRMRYEVTSYVDYRFGLDANRAQLDAALRFDESRNPRTVALGRQWAAEDPDPRAILAKAAVLFNSGTFAYTLEPPLLERRHPFDDFLFRSKQGFCEHYAGSFTLLMRAAGVPARVVTGYQGGEVNPLNGELIVRQADAHAWSEIWIADQGWIRIDPTASVSPLRVENGVNAAVGPIGVIPSIIDADPTGLFANLRYAWHAVNSEWESWVVGYNLDRQRQFFSNLGYSQVDWSTLGFWLMVAIFAVSGAVTIGLLVHERPPRREASLVAWNRFCAKLGAAGLARAPHEGPLAYLARVSEARPGAAAQAGEITRRYIEARYGAGASREELRELARLVKEFRTA